MTSNEVIAEYDEGVWSKGDALSKISEIAVANGAEATIRALPEDWRKDLENWIFEVYDNDIDSDVFFSYHDPDPDLVLRRRHIAALRAWIATKKAEIR